MSITTVFIIAVLAVAVVAVASIVAVAAKRPKAAQTLGTFDRRARQRDALARKARKTAATETEAVSVLPADVGDGPLPDPVLERVEISQEDFDVTRRQFLNRSLLGVFGVFLAQFAIAGLAFFWPKLKGGFGTPINVGNVQEILAEVNQADGTVVPKFNAAAQAWIVPFRADVDESDFAGKSVVAGGLAALWQRCVHLGCRVPECVPSQGFECPCHGSKYNFHGEYVDGPAPRNMDRFVVAVTDEGDLIVDTGAVIQTARTKVKTIPYPQGPTCN